MTGLLAALPMYDRAETAAATNRYWAAIRSGLGFGPTDLTRDRDVWEIWASPDLLLAQTCGYPYRARLHGQVQLVGTPDFGLPGCAPGFYNSVFVVRADDPAEHLVDMAGKTFAYNEALSQSGWAAPKTLLDSLGITPGVTTKSGAHVTSARMVANGAADFAALDAQTWRLAQRFDGFAHELRVLDQTPPTPGLPYITGLDQDASAVRDAVAGAIQHLNENDRNLLGLCGIVSISSDAYLAVPSPAAPE